MIRRMLLALSCATFFTPAAASAKCEVAQLAELKVTMVGAKPMVDAQINGHPVRFVADSGAFFSSISPGSAREFGLSLSSLPPGLQIRGIGGSADAALTRVKDFTLAGIPLHNIPFIVGGSEVGPGAGLLGQNVLGLGDVEYDLEHGMIRLMRAKGCKDLSLAYWAADRPVSIIETEPRDQLQTHTIGTVYLNGARLRAVFDTGASTSVLSLAAAARAGIRPDSPGVVAAGSSRGLGRHTVPTWIAPFDSFKVGGEEIHRTRLRIGDIGLPNADMLIGADFFLSHRLYVANGERKLFFTYDGGPIFNITPNHAVDGQGEALALPTDVKEPTDAAGFSGRGTAFAARRQFVEAEADLDHAIALAPTESRYFYERAMVRLARREQVRAAEDLDQALKLAPDDPRAHMVRARLRLAAHDRPGALADIAAAEHGMAPASDLRLELGELYESVDAFDQAIPQYDAWLRAHPDDSRKPTALNARCWVRALAGRDLQDALSDCDAAIRAARGNASYLDSRGLVRLRLGHFDKAIADYDAALAIRSNSAWSLYGRGVAKRRLGQAAAADLDIAAALAIAPHLGERFRKLGIAD
ncbi:hypothetical protein BH10PSE14_BH10PSE14_37570 [soil metagenome]